MADQIQFDIVTPEALLASDSADMVVVPGMEGDFGVLPGHAAVMSTLRPGFVEIHKGSSVEKVFVAGGFADVSPNGLTLLAEEAVAPDKLTGELFDRLIEAANLEAERAPGEIEVAAANQRAADLAFLRAQVNL
jgi:F-type H+-transporting ATPase subunit epsilon